MNRTLRRPMFRMGGSAEGITSGLSMPRQGYKDAKLVEVPEEKVETKEESPLLEEIPNEEVEEVVELKEPVKAPEEPKVELPENIMKMVDFMKDTGGDPVKIIETKGLKQKSDPKELEALIDKISDENEDKVSQYKSGKNKLFGFFVGQTMKVSGGTANPKLVNDILKNKLK